MTKKEKRQRRKQKEEDKLEQLKEEITNSITGIVNNTIQKEAQQLLDINTIQQHKTHIKHNLKHQQKQNNIVVNDMVEGIQHLDKEEELVRQELQVIEGLERQELEEENNIEEIITESQLFFDNISDFYQQIEKLDNFNETIDMLVRQQDNFENLSNEDQLSVIEFISKRF